MVRRLRGCGKSAPEAAFSMWMRRSCTKAEAELLGGMKGEREALILASSVCLASTCICLTQESAHGYAVLCYASRRSRLMVMLCYVPHAGVGSWLCCVM